MEHLMKDKLGVCQIPPTLIQRENWYAKPWTAIKSQSMHTKAAFLQFTTATLYLLIGVVSFSANVLMEGMLFNYEGTYQVSWKTDTAFLTFFSVTIIPLAIGAIGLILFYGLLMKSMKSWSGAILLNIFQILAILATFIPVLITVNRTYIDPSPPELFFQQIDSFANLWGILVYLVPILVILSFTLVLYLGIQLLSQSMAPIRDYKSYELQKSKGIRRRRK